LTHNRKQVIKTKKNTRGSAHWACIAHLTYISSLKNVCMPNTSKLLFKSHIAIRFYVKSVSAHGSHLGCFTVFRLLTDFVCLYTYELWLSLCKIVQSSFDFPFVRLLGVLLTFPL
jgi:hypothetical protein